MKSLENSSQIVFLMNVSEKYPFFANKKALQYYCNDEGNVEINSIFTNQVSVEHFTVIAYEQLQKKDYALLYDVSTTTKAGEIKICDIQIKYCDDEKTVLFLELFPKVDRRMELAIQQVNQSHRAEGIFHFDEKLTLVHCNDLLYDVFDMTLELAIIHYDNKLSNSFLPHVREKLLYDIHENLTKSDFYTTQLQVITTKQEEKWYSFQLQRRTLDDSGLDKILVYMTNIEKQVELEEQLEDINQYFNILQTMMKGILYRYDIHTRTLYRSVETAKGYNIPTVTYNFPNETWLQEAIHPEDREKALAFIYRLIDGYEGSETVRFITNSGEFAYHKFTFQALRHSDGSIKEMIGNAINVQDTVELESTAKNVKKQFDVLERVCEDRLSFIDFKTRVIIHNECHAAEIGAEVVEERFPESILVRVHPEDVAEFEKFAESNLQGIEGTLTFRMLINYTDYEWFEVTAFIVRDEYDEPEQIVARVKNVHNIQELQSKVADFNKQFDIIEKICNESLIQVDFDTKVMVHRGNHASQIGVRNVEENFPECVYPRIYPDDLPSYKKYTNSVLNGNEGSLTVRMRVIASEHEYEWFQMDSYLIYDFEGNPEQIIGTVRNVHSQQEMMKRANMDMLTGCLNKMATLEQISEILQASKVTEKHALLFLDLDDFKYVNDHLGHAFGDYLLKELGKRLAENVRTQDLVGRVGGDEFVIFLKNIPSEEILLGKGKIILSSISEDVVNGELKHSMKGSIGIAVYPDHGTTFEELYHHADISLYRSKHQGKNTVNIFTKEEN